ncbi:TPA: abortive infection system antitoxin AbiGi family protein [Serratia fonticola]
MKELKEMKKVKSLYPTTLFHFTSEIESLKKILRASYFEVSYAKEVIFSSKSRTSMGIPMVSFCDIRLSQLHEHAIKYGPVGLGMKKSWAIKSGLNPVIYINQHSDLFKLYNDRMIKLNQEVGKIANSLGKDSKEFQKKMKEYREAANLIRYVKNYEGTLNRIGYTPIKNYRFADENEWRYVPGILQTKNLIVSVPSEDNIKKDPKQWKAKFNAELRDSGINLKFSLDDIKYIIVNNEESIDELIVEMKKIYPADKVDKLISRIFCTTQIYDDL